jgi:hypothetical protein
MKKIFASLAVFCIALSAFTQHKTAAHYWGRVPSLPAASRESFMKFLEDCESLSSEISEEGQKQSAMLEQKAATVNPAAVQAAQNMSPAAVQKMMKRIEDRTNLVNAMNAEAEALKKQLDGITADYEKAYAAKVKTLEDKARKLCPDGAMSVSDEARVPACDAALKELDKARAGLLNDYFLGSQSPFQGYLSARAAWIKKTEPQLIKLRDESFEGTGINVKGMPCGDVLKEVSAYLADLKYIFQKAMDDGLVR